MPDRPYFDQRDQTVTYQFNAAGNIHFGQVQNRADVVAELEKLQGEVGKAKIGGALDEEEATDASNHITQAVLQARKPEPDKATVLDHLSKARNVVEAAAKTTGALSGLVLALSGAAELIQRFFQ